MTGGITSIETRLPPEGTYPTFIGWQADGKTYKLPVNPVSLRFNVRPDSVYDHNLHFDQFTANKYLIDSPIQISSTSPGGTFSIGSLVPITNEREIIEKLRIYNTSAYREGIVPRVGVAYSYDRFNRDDLVYVFESNYQVLNNHTPEVLWEAKQKIRPLEEPYATLRWAGSKPLQYFLKLASKKPSLFDELIRNCAGILGRDTNTITNPANLTDEDMQKLNQARVYSVIKNMYSQLLNNYMHYIFCDNIDRKTPPFVKQMRIEAKNAGWLNIRSVVRAGILKYTEKLYREHKSLVMIKLNIIEEEIFYS